VVIKNLGAEPDTSWIALIKKDRGLKLLYRLRGEAILSICTPVKPLSLSRQSQKPTGPSIPNATLNVSQITHQMKTGDGVHGIGNSQYSVDNLPARKREAVNAIFVKDKPEGRRVHLLIREIHLPIP
jgi:hypothetical protein